MSLRKRPDLSERKIVSLVTGVLVTAIALLVWPSAPAPGSSAGQLSASLGALLLLTPLIFSISKRSGLSASPPGWFVAHVLATAFGCCFIFVHVATANWLSPPGTVLLLLVFLIVQGSLMRAVVARGFSLLFARSSCAQGFTSPADLDPLALRQLIDAKVNLLQILDPEASEALFSPALKHWLKQPRNSAKYQRLAAREIRMIGARRGLGVGLNWSRRIHLLAALGFYLGLFAHIIVVLFFAGYAADGAAIDWWYITDWGA